MRHSFCYQKPLTGGQRVPLLLMCKYALRLRYIWLYTDGQQVWSVYMRFCFPRLESMSNISDWVKKRPKRGWRHLECRQALQLLSRAGDAGSMCTTLDFYSGLIEVRANDG